MIEDTLLNVFILELSVNVYSRPHIFFGRSKVGQYDKEKKCSFSSNSITYFLFWWNLLYIQVRYIVYIFVQAQGKKEAETQCSIWFHMTINSSNLTKKCIYMYTYHIIQQTLSKSLLCFRQCIDIARNRWPVRSWWSTSKIMPRRLPWNPFHSCRFRWFAPIFHLLENPNARSVSVFLLNDHYSIYTLQKSNA